MEYSGKKLELVNTDKMFFNFLLISLGVGYPDVEVMDTGDWQ